LRRRQAATGASPYCGENLARIGLAARAARLILPGMDTNATDMPKAAHPTDYERIARAIAYLQRHAAAQPDLASVGRHVHLSEFHFQRLFLRWAGVSPKRFLQHLTLADAKARIARRGSLMDALAGGGLSGLGRLHDLFVTLEAMTPGEYRSGGAGLDVSFGFHESPFGCALIASTARGICALRFVERANERLALELLRDEWARARLMLNPIRAGELGRRIFDPLSSRTGKPLALLVKGTNFQVQVWRALLEIPAGALASYGDIAARIGSPHSARAVGTAVGANPIAYLIPCHRVIRETGHLGGYRWGAARKAAILGWEAARAGAPAS